MMRTPVRCCSLCMALALTGSALAADQSTTRQADTPLPIDRGADAPVRVGESGYRFSLSPFASHGFSADLKDASGGSQVTRAGSDFALSVPINADLSLTLGARGEYSNYLLSGWSEPLGDALLRDAMTLGISPGFTYKISDQWSIFASASVGLSGEFDAELSDALQYGGFAGVRYALNEKLQLSLGVGVSSSFEDDVNIIPIIGGSWTIAPGLSLVAAGPAIRLVRELTPQWTAAVGVGYEKREYRLSEDNLLPGGAVSDARVPVGFELGWRPNAATYLRASTGAVVYQKYDLHRSDGMEVAEFESDVSPFVALSATIRF